MKKEGLRSIVIFYSYEGNTRFIAQIIAKTINADLLELKPIRDMKSKGFMKYVWGGKKVILKQKPALEPFDVNFEAYNVFFIGTPVWAFTYTPALRSFFSSVSFEQKKIAIFCCHEGGMGSTLDNMVKKLQGNTIIGTNDFLHPLVKEKKENENKAIAWAMEMISDKA